MTDILSRDRYLNLRNFDWFVLQNPLSRKFVYPRLRWKHDTKNFSAQWILYFINRIRLPQALQSIVIHYIVRAECRQVVF